MQMNLPHESGHDFFDVSVVSSKKMALKLKSGCEKCGAALTPSEMDTFVATNGHLA
jgi:hypothetical protein